MLNPCTSAVGTEPSPMWQSNTTHVKQAINIYKQKDHNYVLCIYHCSFVCMGLSLITMKRLTSDCLMHTKGIK